MNQKEYIIIDTYLNVDGFPTLLRIETERDNKDIEIPDFLIIYRDVTEELEFETRTLANEDYKMPEKDKLATLPANKEEQKKELN